MVETSQSTAVPGRKIARLAPPVPSRMRPVPPVTEKSTAPESGAHAPPLSAVPQPLATVRVNVSVAARLVAGAIARTAPTARLEMSFTCAPFVRSPPLERNTGGSSSGRRHASPGPTCSPGGRGSPAPQLAEKPPTWVGACSPAAASARGATVPDPMARLRSTYVCGECGGEQARWLGRCPDCGAFATLVEHAPASEDARSGARRKGAAAGVVVPLASVETTAAARIGTGIAELDRVLGGGLVPGSIVLLGGEPGVGKSSLTAAMLGAIGAQRPVLLVAGEESPEQVRLRAERIGATAASACWPRPSSSGLRHDRGDRARQSRGRLDPDALGRAAGRRARIGVPGARVGRAAAARGQGAASPSC